MARCVALITLAVMLASCSAAGPRPRPEAQVPSPEEPELAMETVAPVETAPLSPESVLLAEADQYYSMAVTSAAVRDFDDAEYNFEKALELLAQLDPETTFTDEEEEHISRLLENIGEDYGNTVRARGDKLSSPEMSAFMMRFEDLEALRNWRDYAQVQRTLQPDSVTYDLPIVWNDRVKNCIFYFETIARTNMEAYLQRSGRYLPLMQDIFASYGLPTDLCYLPLIESGFNAHAYSYARAMGPWQFIAGTGTKYGLDRDWWRDERKDFVRSTHAAAQYLRDLYAMFGDWYLALASYNGGEGRVSRTIKKQNTNDFWQLRLRKQTENYVPLFLAAVIIAKEPARFGFHVEPDSPLRWDEVTVDKPIELSVVARHLSCGVDHLKELNPELLRGVTPPRQGSYVLRVPVGKGDLFAEVYDEIPQSERTEWVRHTIRKGETLSGIARSYGVSTQAVKDANRMRSNRIIAGHQLTIPVPVGYRASSGSRTVVASTTGKYRVRPGDTMWDIAQGHGITVDELAQMNKITGRRRIYPGQILTVPGRPTETGDKGAYAQYRVQDGETLWDIARAHGTSTSALARLNDMSEQSRVQAGQELLVPDPARAGNQTYVVKRGDTLTGIARRFGIGVSELARFNAIGDPERIAIGMTLVIPGVR